MNAFQRTIAALMTFAILLSEVAVPVSIAAQHSDVIAPLFSMPKSPERPLQKAVANLTAKTELKPEVLGLMDGSSAERSAQKRLPIKVEPLKHVDFKADEEVSITVNNPDKASFTTRVIDAEGEEQPVEVHTFTNGPTTELQIDSDNQFTPGKYTIEITDQAGQTTTQDFTWGVLAMNPDKSIYSPDETAFISLAVLDEMGEMVCDANVTVSITKPDGTNDVLSTDDKKIITNKECHSKAFTLKPDYETSYKVADVGEYKATLRAITRNGSYTITDNFYVQAAVAYDIKRTSATRIYPPLVYPVNLEITANEDFEGTITETVPESFTITPASEANSYDKMNTLYLNAQNDPAKKLQQNVLGSATGGLVMPFDGAFQITQGFGVELTDSSLKNFYTSYGLGGHDGVDFALPTGTPLYAVDDGNILVAGYGDYGITVIIQHSWGRSYYGHLSNVTVAPNTSVTKGSHIGYSGNTGESTGPHLHFGMKPESPDTNNGYAGKIDPLAFLPQQGTNTARALNLTNLQAVLSASTSADATADKSDLAEKASVIEPQIAPEPEAITTEVVPVAAIASASATTSSQTVVDYTVQDDQIRKDVAYSTSPKIEKVKVIKWQVSLKKGEKTTLSYAYKAPQVSPQFYTVGPLKFFAKTSQNVVFEEKRVWQIAADAVGVDWYNNSWRYRKSVTIDKDQVGRGRDPWCSDATGVTCNTSWLSRKKILLNNSNATEALSNFPVLVKLNSTRIDYIDTQSAGQDLRFVDPSNPSVALNHEIENYDESGNEFIWVEVPSVDAASSTDYIWMYYNNPAASSPATQLGNTSHATGTWDSNFQAVMHLNENPTTTCSGVNEVCDSTTNANHGNGAGAAFVAGDSITGQVGNAISLDVDSYFVQTANASLNTMTTELTVSLWMTSDTFTSTQFRRAVSRNSTPSQQWFIEHDGTTNGTLLVEAGNATMDTFVEMQTGAWYYVTMTKSISGNIRNVYVNGVREQTNTATVATGTVGNVGIGADANGTTPWDGDLDEIRYSNVARSASWVDAEYRTMSDMMASYGPEESQSPPIAAAWCNDVSGITCTSSWASRKKVYLHNGAYGTNLTNFPVAIVVDSSRIDYGKTQSTGADIRFVDSANPNVVLSHEIEGTWNESGTSVVWVEVPQLDTGSNSDYIWMYYDNASASSGEDALNVWDGNYEGIYHMDTNPAAACSGTSEICDSSTNANNGDSIGAMTAGDLVSGQLGNSIDLDGVNDGFQIPDSNNSFDVTNLTTSIWVKRNAAGTSEQLVGRQNGIGVSDLWQNYISNLENYYFNAAGIGTSDNSTAANDVGLWEYITYTYNGSLISFYKNGTLFNTTAATVPLAAAATNICIGGGANDATLNCTSEFVNGTIDEVRISGIGRSADWVKAEYFSTNDSMTTFDEEEGINGFTLLNYPVLINLTSDAELASKAQIDGDDILFTDSTGKTKIPHEIETYTTGTGALVAWIKPSSINDATDTELYMYYGNPAATNQQDITNTWDSNFELVHHDDESSGTTNADSTSNANTGNKFSATQPNPFATGKIGRSNDFAGGTGAAGTESQTVPSSASLVGITQSSYTWSAWINPDTIPPTGAGVFDYGIISRAGQTTGLRYTSNQRIGFDVWNSTSQNWFAQTPATTTYPPGAWYYVVGVLNSTTKVFDIYVNGTLQDRDIYTGTLKDYTTNPIRIGRYDTGACSSSNIVCFDGKIDEVRINSTNRSADWIATDYNNQNSPSTFYALGSEETYIYAPTNAELMRHGKFFDSSGSEQPFAY